VDVWVEAVEKLSVGKKKVCDCSHQYWERLEDPDHALPSC